MEVLNEVYNDLLTRGVMLFAQDYRGKGASDATVIKYKGRFAVFLDIDQIRTLRQEKEAVVHEWAHIACDATYALDAPAAIRQKAEERAHRTELKRLVPFDALNQAVTNGITEPFDLSELFNVSEQTVLDAVALYTGPMGMAFGT